MLIVKHGWDSDLLPFGKIRGEGFVAGKWWSLLECLPQEKHEKGNQEGEREKRQAPVR